ncbi:MAG: phenylalanine--tRNA ligase subunit beta [Rhodospirillales bacterium]|nr:phenylalanine--tRNA ligase subunit beta [Alphaproteobacteria bacterium]MCB9986404.1 phenylalanine--tRNA ligase subunit beta [Rhodospirillales bacterium]USO07048.1 MAG: phenylalanine--tRNA ligase subunit beta [Rhodospirillales bacterium]
MKFTLSWLKEHLDTTADLDSIVTTLTAIGLEVESVEDKAAIYAPFKTAKVVSAEKHPDADRLRVLMVDAGDGKPVQVVCGAPNARAGMTGVFAPEGSYIPGLDTILKKGVIRGVESCGMMVSEREMKLSDEHTGIIDLPAETAAGLPMAPLFGLDDPVIEINLTPNRADCAGVRGIARDLAAKGIGTLKPLDQKAVTGQFDSPIKVDIQARDACPLFIGRMVRGVANGPSPEWLQTRLKAIGLRPISALVDITNYFTIGLNRPLHVFDADKIKGNIHVRLSRAGETLDALNDKSYTLGDGMTVVCDDSGVLGLGGIIGGTSTGCSENTVNVYVEAAYFNPIRTATTGRALQIHSDARYRFERGIDPDFTAQGMELATAMILDLCGGVPGSCIAAGAVPPAKPALAFNPDRTERLSGIHLSHQEQHHILAALGFGADAHKIPWTVTIPSWRPDIEGNADLIEEITRIHGFDSIKPVSMTRDSIAQAGILAPDFRRRQDARRALAARGLKEAVTWSFMQSGQAAGFEAKPFSDDTRAGLTLSNAISSEMDRMRPSILPNLLQAAQRNADRGFPNAALFEIGPVFTGTEPGQQAFVATGIRHGALGARHWQSKDSSRAVGAYDAKADAMAALEACGMNAQKIQITNDAPGYYHPGRSATLRQGACVLGWFGELHPAALEMLDVKSPASGFELFLDSVPYPKRTGSARPLLKPSPLQPIVRDFAFVVGADVSAETIIKLATGAARDLVDRVEVFDVYAGKGIPSGSKSIAISVILQPREKTLTDAEIENVGAGIVKAVADKTGAALRG